MEVGPSLCLLRFASLACRCRRRKGAENESKPKRTEQAEVPSLAINRTLCLRPLFASLSDETHAASGPVPPPPAPVAPALPQFKDVRGASFLACPAQFATSLRKAYGEEGEEVNVCTRLRLRVRVCLSLHRHYDHVRGTLLRYSVELATYTFCFFFFFFLASPARCKVFARISRPLVHPAWPALYVTSSHRHHYVQHAFQHPSQKPRQHAYVAPPIASDPSSRCQIDLQ